MNSEKINYLGNPLLKKANVPIDFTPEQIEEYVKCGEDPIYFIKNYMQIVNVDEGLMNFEMWDFQDDMINNLCTKIPNYQLYNI